MYTWIVYTRILSSIVSKKYPTLWYSLDSHIHRHHTNTDMAKMIECSSKNC